MAELAIDCSYSKPDPRLVKQAGYVGVISYLSHDPRKNWTPGYRDACFAQGLLIALVFEDAADRALSGGVGGHADGLTANQQADALGWPQTRPIYYAVDFDVQPAQLATVLAYLTAAHAVQPMRAAGEYGGLRLVSAAQNTTYRWQTEAWSGLTVSPAACLYQRVRPTRVIPSTPASAYDEDVILGPDWGAWHPSAPSPPAPLPPPPAPDPLQLRLDQAKALAHQIESL